MIPVQTNHPGDIDPRGLMEDQEYEIPNGILIGEMKDIDQQIIEWADFIVHLNNLLIELREIQGYNAPDEVFVRAIERTEENIYRIVGDINNYKARRLLLEDILIHNNSDEGLDWQDWVNKEIARQELGLPQL
jgi:hypothetical protein